MYKKIIGVLLCAAMLVGLFSCGASNDDAMAGKVELDLLNYVDMSAPQGRTWELIRRKFEAAYPNITLKIENQFDEAYHTKLRARAASGSLPDVMYLWPGARTGYVTSKGLIADLTKDVDLTQWAEVAVASQGDNGELWQIPIVFGNGTSVMFANNEILDELGLEFPKTYADLKAMVEPLKAAGYDTMIMSNADTWVMNSCLFSTILGRVAGREWIKKAVRGEAKFTDSEFVKALSVVNDLYRDGILPNSSVLLSYGNGPGEFAAKKAPFYIDGQWRTGDIEPLIDMSKVSFHAFPAIPGEIYPNSVSVVAGAGMGMRHDISGEKKEAALKFIQFYAGVEAAEVRLTDSGDLPSIKGIDLASFEGLPPSALKKADFYSKYTASTVIDAHLVTAVNDVLINGLQSIGLGDKTPEQVAAEVQTAFDDSNS